MPPQPGVFSVPYGMGHKSRSNTAYAGDVEMGQAYQHHPIAGSSRAHEEGNKKERKRKDLSGKLGKEMNDRREDNRHFNESISALHGVAHQLSTRPESNAMYKLRLYPISLERTALLTQLEFEERNAIDSADNAYNEERERVEEEFKRGRERVKERLMEGIEERRRRAREEKDGEGTAGDAALDSHSRPPITRKLRNKLGTSPPPTPLGGPGTLPAAGAISHLPITTGPFLNPHSLSVDELPSPFPLPLTSTTNPNAAPAATAAPNGRRRPKGGGGQNNLNVGGLGKSLSHINNPCKESEIESDLGDIRRGNKRRRAVQASAAK
ncbi:hypothetical protein FA13DRAFT_1773327 [Coprinellus micaceus]|uniref:Uncharacterized protein n=1 Tax=Coprinellus micaceus TaxID=71717 RepID=A0A4Y7THN2_COPMI|nr:hypothetical protein FA13DRAFT_1773327 [Coprinellus micaceus]